MADDEETFDAADVMQDVVRTKTVPPPTRRPSRLQALSMLAAVTAATISAHSGLRNAVGIVIAREGADASSKPIWKALSPKSGERISGSLHKIMLKPATAAGRALAQAAEGTKCYMFKRDQCPRMIHPNTVLMLTASGLLCVAYTICYVNGMVGSSLGYQKFNGRKCKDWQCDVNLHHVTTASLHSALCFVPNKINKLISQIVSQSPPSGVPRKNVEASYKAFAPDVILNNISKLKRHEDSIRAGDVDCVEIQRGTSKDRPSALLYSSLKTGQPNFDLYLERADSDHRRLAGVGTRDQGIYQFVSTSRPDFIHPSCVIQEWVHKDEWHSSSSSGIKMIRVLHCRCPILGIGGTKVGGGSSGEEAKNKTWPVVLHHLGKDDLSLVVFCRSEVNLAIDLIP